MHVATSKRNQTRHHANTRCSKANSIERQVKVAKSPMRIQSTSKQQIGPRTEACDGRAHSFPDAVSFEEPKCIVQTSILLPAARANACQAVNTNAAEVSSTPQIPEMRRVMHRHILIILQDCVRIKDMICV